MDLVGKDNADSIDTKTMFRPSLWKQRRTFAIEQLVAMNCRRVIDFGCGQGAIIQEMLNHEHFTEVFGLDISLSALSKANARSQFDRSGIRMGRSVPINLELFHGSLKEADARFIGFEALVCLEVVEHLEREELEMLPCTIFGRLRPGTVILSTPNAEFNVHFPELQYGTDASIFRHGDHKFEWTRNEFESWAKYQASQYGYNVSFSGVGQIESSNVGFCSQIAIFTLDGQPRKRAFPFDTFDGTPYATYSKITYPIPQKTQAKISKLTFSESHTRKQLGFSRTFDASSMIHREIPRTYQILVFERAKVANVIAVLETGVGKVL